jgi:hypothetical protein
MSISRYGANYDDRWLLAGQPSGVRNQNLDQLDLTSDLAALTTQVMLSVLVPVQPGELITNISFVSGATAANTPTNWWFALYSSAATPALLAQTADQTSTAWAANTVKTVALATPQRIASAGFVYAAIMVKATAPPSLQGKALALASGAGAILGSSVLAQTSGSALTTTAPGTIASPTTVATVPFCALT